jgi:MFS family permease
MESALHGTPPGEEGDGSATRVQPDRGGIWAPLSHREYTLFWVGTVVSYFGDCLQLYAQSWLVAEMTGSALALSSVGLAQAVPRVVLGLFAGVIVDRLDRRAVMLASQSLALLQSLAFLLLLVSGRITFANILVLSALQGILGAAGTTARVALMPALVPRALVGRAVGLYALGANVVQFIAPAAAGFLISGFGVRGCLVVNLATFVVILATVAAMSPHRPADGDGQSGLSRSFVAGLALLRSRPLLWGTLALTYALGFFGASASQFLALYARVVLRTDARGYGLLVMATGVGAVLASVLVTARTRNKRLPLTILVAACAFSVALGGVGAARSWALAWGALVVLGFMQTAFRSAAISLVQLATPDAFLGRVTSLMSLDFSLWSLGAVLLGAVADRLAFAFAATTPAAGAVGHLPAPAVASGLGATLGGMAIVCLLAALLMARPILRGARDAQLED